MSLTPPTLDQEQTAAEIAVEKQRLADLADKERAELSDLQARQTLAARESRLRKLARRDPAIEEFYAEYQALLAGSKELRTQLAELGAESSRLLTDNVALRQKLDAAETDAAQLRRQAEADAATIERLNGEAVDLREKLQAALKPKKS